SPPPSIPRCHPRYTPRAAPGTGATALIGTSTADRRRDPRCGCGLYRAPRSFASLMCPGTLKSQTILTTPELAAPRMRLPGWLPAMPRFVPAWPCRSAVCAGPGRRPKDCGQLPPQIGGVTVRNDLAHSLSRPESTECPG